MTALVRLADTPRFAALQCSADIAKRRGDTLRWAMWESELIHAIWYAQFVHPPFYGVGIMEMIEETRKSL